ncbi:hypothetical protein [Staphylococcus delphini]|uniref:hypothetical protein n=1 Tax=Staphylococcus delphini TaxID=53344 RepID=UPI0012D33B4D|nr:hypothetical protein [Staphylococcus delphini]MTV20565.1 hypothetical protein [Staphylococcus delphini]
MDLLKLFGPVLMFIIISLYKYIFEDRVSLETFFQILLEFGMISLFYAYLISYNDESSTKIKDSTFYNFTFLVLILELAYILSKNKIYKIVKYDGLFYRLIKYNKDVIKVQTIQEVKDENTKIESTVRHDFKDTSKTDIVNWVKVSSKEIYREDGKELEKILICVDKDSSFNRIKQFKTRYRFVISLLFSIGLIFEFRIFSLDLSILSNDFLYILLPLYANVYNL